MKPRTPPLSHRPASLALIALAIIASFSLGFLLTFFGGLGVLLYLGAWMVIPDEVDGTSIADNMINKRRS